MKTEIESVDAYISNFPLEIQKRLEKIVSIIKRIAPEAVESISYGMPAYKLNKKPLVYFGAFKNHIGFFATPNSHEKFRAELSKNKQGKGSVQFPNNEPLPENLITEMVTFKASDNKL